ncbi:hypothetical protein FJT64_007939 [Amphibalanus amphitrite]|uniref:Uncharacterized protein n=1 Tax=Amphibalanus amphitrite TaxID=1232801 RepID=A0A6A4VSI4_AMPAM|nr:hypothetical protein FJT64_007939 [Amphibalanus amphitrite]
MAISVSNPMLKDATHVFLRCDATKPPLACRYDGPFRVVARSDKTLTLDLGRRQDVVSVDRVKPAHLDPADGDCHSEQRRLRSPSTGVTPGRPAPAQPLLGPRPLMPVRDPSAGRPPPVTPIETPGTPPAPPVPSTALPVPLTALPVTPTVPSVPPVTPAALPEGQPAGSSESKLESQWALLKLDKGQQIIICSLYRPPRHSEAALLADFTDLEAQLQRVLIDYPREALAGDVDDELVCGQEVGAQDRCGDIGDKKSVLQAVMAA